MYQYIPDLNNDGFAGLKVALQNAFHTATGCTANLDFSYDINNYDSRTVIKALQPCSMSNPLPLCGYDMVEVDTATLDDLASHPNLLQEMPASVRANIGDFIPATRKMVKIDGTQWGQPSYSCDNLFMSMEDGLEDIDNRRDLLDWIDDKIAGNSSRLGYTTDLWAVWDLTTIYVDAFLDSHPNRPLCCGANTAYYPTPKPSVARGLADLALTCYDHDSHTNPCLDNTFYFDFGAWFGAFLSGRSVMLQGFSTYLANLRDLGANLNDITVTSAALGTGSHGYLFTDAFVLSKGVCTGSSCVDAAALWLNWQRLEGQILINLGKDLATPRPRYLVSANTNFYSDSRTLPYANIYDYFYNDDCDGTLQLARPLNVQDYTDHYCDLYAALTSYVPTGSSCALQNKANQA
jgi:hypothetical protein